MGEDKKILPFSKLSICSFVKEVLFRCSFLFKRSRAWSSREEAGPSDATELLSPPQGLPLSESCPESCTSTKQIL